MRKTFITDDDALVDDFASMLSTYSRESARRGVGS